MIERVVFRRPEWATVLGSALVLIGLALFMVVFVTLFPVLRDPVGAYDRWFPVDEAPNAVIAADDTPVRNEPIARFTWEAVAVESAVPPIYRVRFQSNAEPGQADIVAWNWAFGDGSQSTGESVTHDYAEYGAYIVSLTVEDAAGAADTLAGEVIVPGIETTSGTIGQVDQLLSLDIEASIEDAVGSVGEDINATIDSAFGSIGKTVRGAVVVFLFALAAFATTMVAWRVARVGVMVLTRRPGAPRSDLQPPPAFDDDASSGNRQLELV